jgi:hypothetical protein
MSEIIGDTQHLHRNTVPFRVVHTLPGAGGSSQFLLFDHSTIVKLSSSYASVRIVEESLSVQIVAPPAADKAISVHVAAIPDKTDLGVPTTAAHILSIAGSAYLEASLYSGHTPTQLQFAIECAHQVKPSPVIGYPPKVCVAWTLQGGESSSVSHLVLSGTLSVDGVGFVQTW